MSLAEKILLLDILLAASCEDLLTGRIPNELMISGFLCSAAEPLLSMSAAGLLWRLLGAASLLLVLYPLFRFRMIGAGDIKLLALAGSYMGFPACLTCLAASMICGGIMAVCLIVYRGNLLSRVDYFLTYLSDYLNTKEIKPYITPSDQGGLFSFALPILFGTVWTMWIKGV